MDSREIAIVIKSSQTYYKKRLVSRINPSLILNIILYNTWTLQQIKFNQLKFYTKDNQGTSLIKHGSLIESSCLCYFNLQNFLAYAN